MTPRARRLSLYAVLVVSLVAVAGLAVIIFAAQQYHTLTGEFLREDLDQDLTLARAVANGLERYMMHRRHLVETIAREIEREAQGYALPGSSRLGELVETANRRDPSFSTMVVVDREGVAVAFSPAVDPEGRPNVGKRYADRRWFQEAIGLSPHPSFDLVIGRAVLAPTVGVATPIRAASGAVIGVVGGGLNLEQLRHSVRDIIRSGPVRLVVTDGRGRVISHTSQAWEAEAHDLSSEQVFQVAQRQPEGTMEYDSRSDGHRRWAAYVRVPATRWVVWLSRGPESQTAKIHSLLRSLLGAGVIGLAVASVVALVVGRLLTEPLGALVTATREVAARRFQGAELLRGRRSRLREYGELLEGFQEMTAALRSQYDELETRVAERTRALEEAARRAEAGAARLRAQDAIQRGYAELAALLNSLDRSIVLNEAARKVAATLAAPVAAVFLTDGGADRLRLKTYAAVDDGIIDASLLAADGLPAEVARRRESIVVSTGPDRAHLRLRTGLGEVDIAAVAGFPLATKERFIGVLTVALLEAPSQETLGFLEAAARQLAVALNNASLYEALRSQSQELERLNVELRQASDTKSQFLSSMSHELRTPLNAIIGFTDILLASNREPLSDRQRAAMQKVRDSGHHLLGLINQVLDLSKIEAGRMEVHPEPFPLSALVAECLATVEPAAQAKGLALRSIGLEPSLDLVQDRGKVKQILLNLLSNAAKFTSAGFVEVRVEQERDDFVVLAVADSGPGIRPKDQEAVFDEFRQVDGAGSAGGTGLGLAICRRLAALLDGTLTVESVPGQGSVFLLRLPRRLRESSLSSSLVQSNGGATSREGGVLVIDDDQNAVDIIREALTDEPVAVEWARNAVAGLTLARTLKPAVIILDVMLRGDEDGWAVLDALKREPAIRDIPVILHSAIDSPQRARRLGADEVLVKPAPAATIRALVRKHCGATVSTAGSLS